MMLYLWLMLMKIVKNKNKIFLLLLLGTLFLPKQTVNAGTPPPCIPYPKIFYFNTAACTGSGFRGAEEEYFLLSQKHWYQPLSLIQDTIIESYPNPDLKTIEEFIARLSQAGAVYIIAHGSTGIQGYRGRS